MSDKIPSRTKRLLAVAFVRFFGWMPLWLAQAIGSAMGQLTSFLPVRSRKTVETNLALCFPEMDEAARRRLMRAYFRETGKAFTETCGIWLHRGDRYTSKIRNVEGFELIKAARASGDGLLLLVPHLGNWEIAGNWCASRFWVTGMYRPSKYPEIDHIMLTGREQYGGKAVPTDASGVRAMVKTLAEGKALFLLPDHEPDLSGGEFAPLFGVPALTGTLAAKLSNGRRPVRTLLLYARRLPCGQGWDIVFREVEPGLHNDDTVASLSALNRSLEELIRECPEQYQWTYKRFKRRPAGQPELYKA